LTNLQCIKEAQCLLLTKIVHYHHLLLYYALQFSEKRSPDDYTKERWLDISHELTSKGYNGFACNLCKTKDKTTFHLQGLPMTRWCMVPHDIWYDA